MLRVCSPSLSLSNPVTCTADPHSALPSMPGLNHEQYVATDIPGSETHPDEEDRLVFAGCVAEGDVVLPRV